MLTAFHLPTATNVEITESNHDGDKFAIKTLDGSKPFTAFNKHVGLVSVDWSVVTRDELADVRQVNFVVNPAFLKAGECVSVSYLDDSTLAGGLL